MKECFIEYKGEKKPAKVRINILEIKGKQLTVKWYAASGAKKYQVYRRKVGGKWKLAKTVKAPKKNCKLKRSSTKDDYEVRICAVNGKEKGPFSDIMATVQINPTVTVDGKNVTVTWTKLPYYSKYEVYCKLFQDKKKIKKVKTQKGTTYKFSGKYSTRYRVQIKGVNSGRGMPFEPVEFETGSNPALSVKRIVSLPSHTINSNYYASRIDAITFVGDDLYYLKSAHNAIKDDIYKGKYYPMSLACIKDFNSYPDTQNRPAEFKAIKYQNGELYYAAHGSSITYAEGYFYIVTVGNPKNNKQIIKVDMNGKVVDEIGFSGFSVNELDEVKFSAMAYMGKGAEITSGAASSDGLLRFICRDGKNTLEVNPAYGYERHRFSIGVLKGSTLYCEQSYMSRNEKGQVFNQSDKDLAAKGQTGLHANDIAFDPETGLLHHSIFVYEKDGSNIKDNWVYSYNVFDSWDIWRQEDNFNTYFLEQDNVFKYSLDSSNSSETKFEIEGVDVYNGHVYLAVNNDGVEDALYMIK